MSIQDVHVTSRQREILLIIRKEPAINHIEIAQRLGISKATVERHLALLYQGFYPWGVRDKTSLMVILMDQGWFDGRAETQTVKTNG